LNKQDFKKVIRQSSAQFHVDDVLVSMDSGQLHGKGRLEATRHGFKLSVTLDEGCLSPKMPEGIKMRREFWTVQGKIEDEISFTVRSLPSSRSENYTSGPPYRVSLEFSANQMELAPIGFECLTSQQVCELQQQATGQPIAAGVEAPPQNTKVAFHAVLPNFKLIERNGVTETTKKNVFLGESHHSSLDTFHAEISDWEYGLVEQDGDLHVHLHSKAEHQSAGEDHDWRLFRAFLNALAFTHAQHAWPFSVEHRRDGKLLTDRIQLNENAAISPHAPFSEALAFNNRTKKLSWKYEDALEKAYTFFRSDAKLAREAEHLLFIFREATAQGIPKRIALLSLCSLLESLVRAIYEEEIAPTKAAETADFQKVKKEVCADFNQRGQPAYQRLSAIITSADSVNIRMRFDAVFEHLGLKPPEKWQELHRLWSKFRNPISHRMSKANESDESYEEDLLAESRIAGAINCMILKLMNYSGYVRRSAFEAKYAQI